MPIEKPNKGQGYTPRTLQEIFREMPEMEIPAGMAAARSARLQIQDLSTSIRILDQEADHLDSMRILEENNLRPLTYKEVLTILTESEEIKEKLKDKWFWLAGKGSDREEEYHFDGNDLVKGEADDIEKNVYCWRGKNPLSFVVRHDTDSHDVGGRFALSAYRESEYTAWIVVGVPK